MSSDQLIEKLKDYRKEKGLNQVQMSIVLDISHRKYQEIEKSGIVKKAETLNKINGLLTGKSTDDTQNIAVSRPTTNSETKNDSGYTKEYVDHLKEELAYLRSVHKLSLEGMGQSLGIIRQELSLILEAQGISPEKLGSEKFETLSSGLDTSAAAVVGRMIHQKDTGEKMGK